MVCKVSQINFMQCVASAKIMVFTRFCNGQSADEASLLMKPSTSCDDVHNDVVVA